MKKVLLGLLVFLVLIGIGVVGCAGGQTTHEVYSGFGEKEMTLTQTTVAYASVPQTYAASPGKNGVTYSAYDSSATSADRMVIYNAYLTIVAENITETLTNITNLAKNYGGFVVNSNISEDQSRLYATISFRVKSEHFDETIHALHTLAVDVKSETTSGQDVTQDYTDLSSKLRNLEASESQLLELMKKAGTVADILGVERELTSTREQIEIIKGRMQYLEQSSNLALFSVNLEQSKLIAEFTAETRTVKEGESVMFAASVSGGFYPYTYLWNFGDDQTSTEANPSHVYHTAGVYTVSLKVTDDKGTYTEYARKDYMTVQAGWNAGSVADSAWNALAAFGRGLAAIFIGLGIWSLFWIPVLIIVLYFTWWRRRKPKK